MVQVKSRKVSLQSRKVRRPSFGTVFAGWLTIVIMPQH